MQFDFLDEIVTFCAENGPNFNCVNVSTALNRIAKLKDDNLHSTSFDSRLINVINLMKAKARQLYIDFKPRELANTLWALAALGVDPGNDLIKKISCRSVLLANNFKPQEIANLFWSVETGQSF